MATRWPQASLQSLVASVGAFSLPATSKDAVLAVTLAPGSYSVQVSGAKCVGTGPKGKLVLCLSVAEADVRRWFPTAAARAIRAVPIRSRPAARAGTFSVARPFAEVVAGGGFGSDGWAEGSAGRTQADPASRGHVDSRLAAGGA